MPTSPNKTGKASTLVIGFGDYDRTRALVDGTVKLEGVDAVYRPSRVITDCFEAMVRDRAYDVAELGLSYFLRTMDLDDPPFIALPIFPNRCFRHSAIYVNVASGIRHPRDLIGKTIGEFAMYGHDAGVWPKGILSDEFGVRPEQSRWVIGQLDWPLKPIDFVAHPRPRNVEVVDAPAGTDLGAWLESGKIDALISADVPKCILEKSPKVARLFADFPATEQDYFTRTGIFPIMHTVVVKRELALERPELLRPIYEGFRKAKAVAQEQYRKGMIFNNMATMMPWFNRLVEDDLHFFEGDWWPYGFQANRKVVDTFCRYHYEQGLSKRGLTSQDLFVPELFET